MTSFLIPALTGMILKIKLLSFLNAKQVLCQLTYIPSLASPMALTANFCWKLRIFCCCVSRFFCSAFTVVFECVIKRLLQSEGLLWFCEFIQWRWHLAKHLFANLPLTNCVRRKEQPYSFAWARSCITCGLQQTDHWRTQLCDQLCI